MHLKSGKCLWPDQNQDLPAYSPLTADLRCDVAVVGAGLTGALIGYSLTRAGFDVVMFDKRDVAQGSTSASTALVLYEIDTPLVSLSRMIGAKRAVRAYHLCRDAIDQIGGIVTTLPDQCGFGKTRSLYLASRKSDLRDLKSEFKARKKADIALDYLSPSDLRRNFAITAPGALLSHDAAKIDPYRFTHRLVARSVADGMRVFGSTALDHCADSGRNAILRTTNVGLQRTHKITAKRVIFATGYESEFALTRKLVQLKSTYALATNSIPDLNPVLHDLCVWETARPYIYFRTASDPAGSRIILGGGDEDFNDTQRRDRLIPSKVRTLQRQLTKLLPHVHAKTEYAWAGTFADTKDGLPYIGVERGHPKIAYAFCYGANGANFAMIAANLITDWMRGKCNKDAAIFSLHR